MSASLANWAMRPRTGRYWFDTSSGGCDNQEEVVHRAAVDRVPLHAGGMPRESHAEPVRHQRTTVGNGDSAPDPGGAEVLTAPEDAEQRGGGAVVGAKQLRHLLQDVVLRRSGEVESHCIVADEITKAHGPPS